MYGVVCLASGVVIVLVIGYAVAEWAAHGGGSLAYAGAAMVDTSFPLANFAQPVAYLSVACVLFFYTGLMLRQSRVARWSHLRLASLQLTAIAVAFVSGYEVIYNFMLWGSYSSLQVLSSNLPAGVSILGSQPTPWSVVFSANLFPAILVVSAYSVFFLRKVHQVRGLPDYL